MKSLLQITKITIFTGLMALSAGSVLAQENTDEFPIPSQDNPLPVKLLCDVLETEQKLQLQFEPMIGNQVKIQSITGEPKEISTIAENAVFDDTASDAVYVIRHIVPAGFENVYIVSTFIMGRIWPGGRAINPGKMAIQQFTVKKNAETGAEEFEEKDLGGADLKCSSYE